MIVKVVGLYLVLSWLDVHWIIGVIIACAIALRLRKTESKVFIVMSYPRRYFFIYIRKKPLKKNEKTYFNTCTLSLNEFSELCSDEDA